MGRERASDSLYGTKVVVASVQTLARANRRHRFHPDHFSLMIIDEAHHATASTYREVMNYFGHARKLLVTATPKRGDGTALELVCESVAYQYGIEPAIDDGWLVPIRQCAVKIDGLDFSRARSTAGDFNEADLEKILLAEQPLHEMCSSAHELIGDKQALWFCATVTHAREMSAILKRYAGDAKVAWLSGDTPAEDRRNTIAAYKAGKIQHLLNCALFLEGFDAPTTSVIVMARPTKSLALYMQVLGRGTRVLPDVVEGIEDPAARRLAISMSAKPDVLIVDFVGNAGRHQIVQAIDVLGGKYELPVREYAKQVAESERAPVDLDALAERAKVEMALIEEEDARLAKITAKAHYRTSEVSPFRRERGVENAGPERMRPEGCTTKQANYILFLSRRTGGHWTREDALALSKRQAAAIIGQLLEKTKVEAG
jgi:superfamily II DNA or RNA helicase